MSWSIVLLLTLQIAAYTRTSQGSLPLLWPAGLYGLPQPKTGCPSTPFTWTTGTIYQSLGPKSTVAIDSNLQAKATALGVTRDFCFKNSTELDAISPAWPSGSYCLYMKSNVCPKGLTKGSLSWSNRYTVGSDKNYQTGDVPIGIYNTSTTTLFYCCNNAGNPEDDIDLPITSPFILLTNAVNGGRCQKVRGAIYKQEYIAFDVNETSDQSLPYPYKYKTDVMYVIYCYYQGCSWTYTAPSETITSPSYPNNYPTNIKCQWRIELSKNYQITLYFKEFILQSSALSCNIACTCDKLDVTFQPEGHSSPVIKTYCMKYINAPPYQLNTYSNLVILDFYSDGSISAPGFKIFYTSFLKGTESTSTTLTPTTTPTTTPTSTSTPSLANLTTTTSIPNTSTLRSPTTIPNTSTLRSPPTTKEQNTSPTFPGRVTSKDVESTKRMISTNKQVQKSSYNLKTLVIAVSIAVLCTLCFLGCLLYWRATKGRKVKSWLNVRYSSDSSKLRASTTYSSTINMYSGDDVEFVSEPKESDNPIYSSSNTFIPCDLQEKDAMVSSDNTLYACPGDIKSNNPIYESPVKERNLPEKESENPLYDRIL